MLLMQSVPVPVKDVYVVYPSRATVHAMGFGVAIDDVLTALDSALGNASITSTSAPARCKGGPSALIIRILISMLDVGRLAFCLILFAR